MRTTANAGRGLVEAPRIGAEQGHEILRRAGFEDFRVVELEEAPAAPAPQPAPQPAPKSSSKLPLYAGIALLAYLLTR